MTFSIKDAQNAVRGALGKTSVRDGPGKKPIWRGLTHKKVHVAEIVTDSIARLADHDIDDFAAWVKKYPSQRARLCPPSHIREYKDLWPQPFIIFDDLYKALRWIQDFLLAGGVQLDTYIALLERYETDFLSGNYETAHKVLDQIEAELGLSVWLIQARIFVLQMSKGLEAQKEYARSAHTACPNSIPSFVAHYTSERNEDSTSLDRFTARVNNAIDRQPIEPATKVDLKFRLTGKDSANVTEAELCGLLSAASSYSVIDAYEAFIFALQAVFCCPALSAYIPFVRRSLQRIRVADWRLLKLKAIGEGDYDNLAFRDLVADDALLSGDFDRAIELSIAQAAHTPSDIDSLAVAATAAAFADRDPPNVTLSTIQAEILRLLIAVKAKRGSVAKAGADLAKLVQNGGSLRVSGAIYGYLVSEWMDRPQVGQSAATGLFLSSALANPQHWIVLPEFAANTLISKSMQTAPHHLTTEIAASQLRDDPIPSGRVPPELRAVLNTDTALYHGDIQKTLDCAQTLAASSIPLLRRLAAKIDLHCLLLENKSDAAIKRLVHYCCDQEDFRYVLPLRSLLRGKRWRDLKHLRASIALPIILDLYWKTVDEAEHETNRRIAYDEFLIAHGCRRPSQLASARGDFDKSELIYFLSSVCVPAVMDVSFDVYATSRDILEERISICSLLSELDPPNIAQYAEELKEISTYLSIQDGIRDVDRSRVHVNTEDVTRWAEKELQESFNRYKDLLRAKVGFGSPEDFKKTLRQIEEGDRATIEAYLNYPEQEGDTLLLELLNALKTEYLTNSDYGLDAYLSMRIRHGSLAGHLRGVLEERSLIVSKGEDSKYADNISLANDLGIVTDPDRSCLIESFRKFSARYDSMIEDLTKQKLQIRREERPNGMFYLSFDRNPFAVHFIRSHIQDETSFLQFLDFVFLGIGFLLNPVLTDVRNYITSSVKQAVEAAFEALRSDLERGMSNSRYARLNSAIADVTPEVQAAVDRVAQWFVPVQKEEEAAVRNIEQIVTIGIEVARHAHRGFSPDIQCDVAPFEIKAASLFSVIIDILFTLLDNVYAHSGNKTSPWIKLRIWSEDLEPPRCLVHIRIESEVAAGTYNDGASKKLDRIRGLMDSGEYRKHMNLEGGTGLLKLKRIISLEDRQTLTFDFIGEEAFFVDIGLVLSLIRVPEDQGAVAS